MENEENIRIDIEKAKKTVNIEGACYGVMDGFGIRYITPFALALNASNYAIGILSSLPSLIGNIMQLFSLKLMKKYSRKNIVFYAVLMQTILWLPVIIIGLIHHFFKIDNFISIFLLIITYSLLIGFGNSGSPPWNSWMKDLIKENRGTFFANRNRIINFTTIISMLIAGIVLNSFEDINLIFGFSIIFLIAFFGRLIGAYLMKTRYEPEFKFEEQYYFNILEFIKKSYKNNFGKFVIFVSLISLGTAISAPFFSVYMLKELNFSYLSFTIITLSSVIATILFMPFWGRYADKVGNVKIMKITGMFIPIIPLTWLLSLFLIKYGLIILIPYLFIIELFSGFIWAGFNLSIANFIFDAVSRQRMAICVAYYNFLNAVGTFIGATIGGIIASINFNWIVSSLIIVFIISSITRFVFYFLMIKKIKEVRAVETLSFDDHLKKELKEHNKKVKSSIKGLEKGIKKIFTFSLDRSSPVQIDSYGENKDTNKYDKTKQELKTEEKNQNKMDK